MVLKSLFQKALWEQFCAIFFPNSHPLLSSKVSRTQLSDSDASSPSSARIAINAENRPRRYLELGLVRCHCCRLLESAVVSRLFIHYDYHHGSDQNVLMRTSFYASRHFSCSPRCKWGRLGKLWAQSPTTPQVQIVSNMWEPFLRRRWAPLHMLQLAGACGCASWRVKEKRRVTILE